MKVENKQKFAFNLARIINDFQNRELRNRPLLFVGEQGVGKTAMLKLAAKMLSEITGKDVKCNIVDLHSMDPTDLLGNPYIKDGITYHARPKLLPYDDDDWQILGLDEVNRVMPDMQAPMYNLLSNWKIGEHQLSKNCIIVGLCNPNESEGQGTSYSTLEMDAALIGRFRIYGMAPDPDGTLEYLLDTYGPDDVVYQWLVGDPEVINFKGGKGTPRDMEGLTKTIKAEGPVENIPERNIRGICAADIGPELTSNFINYLELRTICTPSDILFEDEKVWKAKLKAAQDRTNRFNIETSLMRAVADLFLRTDNKALKIENVVTFLEQLGAERAYATTQLMIDKVYKGDKIANKKGHNRLHAMSDVAKKNKSELVKWVNELEELKARKA